MPPPPPVLTLLPAAFRGGSPDGHGLCLGAGQAIEADVWVHQPSVTFTVRGTAEQGGELEATVGEASAEPAAAVAGSPMELTFRLRPSPGLRVLRLARPRSAGGDEICVQQVALTQP